MTKYKGPKQYLRISYLYLCLFLFAGDILPYNKDINNTVSPREGYQVKEPKKDPRETYDYVKDPKYKRQNYADNDVIDRPANQVRRYDIKSSGVPYKEGRNKDLVIEEGIAEQIGEPLEETMDRTPEDAGEGVDPERNISQE